MMLKAIEMLRPGTNLCFMYAGDSMVGGTVYGLVKGHNILQSCHMGMIAARKSLASEHAISPDLAPHDLC